MDIFLMSWESVLWFFRTQMRGNEKFFFRPIDGGERGGGRGQRRDEGRNGESKKGLVSFLPLFFGGRGGRRYKIDFGERERKRERE